MGSWWAGWGEMGGVSNTRYSDLVRTARLVGGGLERRMSGEKRDGEGREGRVTTGGERGQTNRH